MQTWNCGALFPQAVSGNSYNAVYFTPLSVSQGLHLKQNQSRFSRKHRFDTTRHHFSKIKGSLRE